MTESKQYLHGFSREEQDRLYEQARFLETQVYESVDFSGAKKLLEVGCGVGAQTEILLERFKNLKITSVDASEAQLERARERLAGPLEQGRVTLQKADALKLPYPDNSFDSAFICWLLEHVPNPGGILKEVKRVLSPGGKIVCTEVMNATLFLHPYSPCMLQYWFLFNDHQWSLGGDPFVGAKLGNYLAAAGFTNVITTVKSYHYDNRFPEARAKMLDYWKRLLLSGAPSLIEAGKVEEKVVEGMRKELDLLKEAPDSVFFYSCVQAVAESR